MIQLIDQELVRTGDEQTPAPLDADMCQLHPKEQKGYLYVLITVKTNYKCEVQSSLYIT